MSSMLHIRLDDDLKDRGNAALAAMGLTSAEAVRLLYHRIVAEQAFPLELKVPNTATRAAMDEADTMLKGAGARFGTSGDMFSDLEE